MKFLYNKVDLTGKWVRDGSEIDGYTEKVPQDTSFVWDESLDEWVKGASFESPEPIPVMHDESKEFGALADS